MRLSEERINHLVAKIVDTLVRSGAVAIEKSQVTPAKSRVGKVVIDDLHIEDEIDQEARRRLRRMPSAPPEGSADWDTLLRREKESIAQRKGYVI